MRPLRDLLRDQKAALPFDFKFLGSIDIEQTNELKDRNRVNVSITFAVAGNPELNEVTFTV